MMLQAAFIPLGASSVFNGRPLRPRRAVVPTFYPPTPGITAVAAKPRAESKAKKLSRVEGLKTESKQLRYPLAEQLASDEIFINEDAVQIMKFHGSYQQDNREMRAPGQGKKYQFMLRLKMPAGDFPAPLYQVLDDIASEHGNDTLRATTRCAWQVHGILKSDLKPVFSKIMTAGGSCVGACGDLSRNVMCTPAPFISKLYGNARFVSRMLGELFAPQTGAFSEIWLDGEKAASLEFWKKDLDMTSVQEVMRFDNGNGVVYQDSEEPIYGETYLPRKFKIGVTVPGDNSIDIYTQDIGIVCIPDATGQVVGYNLIVGGGMGRTHRKESTFARVGDHLGYVPADKLWEVCKAIVAAQRDHGNRNVRMNARMKYLVDRLGIASFRKLVEGYFGEPLEPFREIEPWEYKDWLGWHEQGDGNLFLGLFVENGRIKDDGDFKLRTCLRRITDAYEFDMVVTPNQNIILKNITPSQKGGIEAILKEHNVKTADEYDANKRISMACPAMPLCGLAVTEAERVMPAMVERMNTLFAKQGVTVPITMRMTGCPNGCARPYMAELGFVGSGPSTYQLWLGGSPNQTRLAWPYLDKVKEIDLEATLAPILTMFARKHKAGEAFGDFCDRMGKAELKEYSDNFDSAPVTRADVSTDVNGVTVAADGVPVPLKYEESEFKLSEARVTVARGAAKVTVLSHSGDVSPADKKPFSQSTNNVDIASASATKSEDSVQDTASVDSGESSKAVKNTGISKKSGKKPRPRLTVSNEIMERLKNIAALRDMSASMVADEIIAAYLSGVEDEDLAMDI